MIDEPKKHELRSAIIIAASKLIGIPYEFGAEWTDYLKPPATLDCSEMAEGIFHLVGLKLPDGSQNQYNFTIKAEKPEPGDLAFFGKGGDPGKIYHVGILYDEKNIIEARAFDGREWTGKVCLREKQNWENYKNFCGYRCHPKLI